MSTSRPKQQSLAVLLALAALAGVATAWLLFGRSDQSVPSGIDQAQVGASEVDITDMPFADVDGESHTLAEFAGQPVVVNFFAATCPPCRQEMPDFEAVHQTSDIPIIGISQDFSTDGWQSMVAETGVTFDTYFEEDPEILSAIGAIGMPTTLFVDADGAIVFSHTGRLTADELRDGIDEHLG